MATVTARPSFESSCPQLTGEENVDVGFRFLASGDRYQQQQLRLRQRRLAPVERAKSLSSGCPRSVCMGTDLEIASIDTYYDFPERSRA
jgi:hypothetical protein